jgi:hypothetical protein
VSHRGLDAAADIATYVMKGSTLIPDPQALDDYHLQILSLTPAHKLLPDGTPDSVQAPQYVH